MVIAPRQEEERWSLFPITLNKVTRGHHCSISGEGFKLVLVSGRAEVVLAPHQRSRVDH